MFRPSLGHPQALISFAIIGYDGMKHSLSLVYRDCIFICFCLFISIIIIIIIITIIIIIFSCHRPFLPGTSLEPAVIPTAQASSFTLQYFPYYV